MVLSVRLVLALAHLEQAIMAIIGAGEKKQIQQVGTFLLPRDKGSPFSGGEVVVQVDWT